jgi:hypothetical protein
MGAVGLNFGSATSGQGFDVTSTVNQIVSNLQTVETPCIGQPVSRSRHTHHFSYESRSNFNRSD